MLECTTAHLQAFLSPKNRTNSLQIRYTLVMLSSQDFENHNTVLPSRGSRTDVNNLSQHVIAQLVPLKLSDYILEAAR